jgi:hypothetical protein
VSSDIEARFGLLAIKTVVPKHLLFIPVEKIIQIRRRFGEQFNRWREDIDQHAKDFADQLGQVESDEVLSAYMEDAVRAYSTAPLEDLRRGLASLGVETVRRQGRLPVAGLGVAAPGGLAHWR